MSRLAHRVTSATVENVQTRRLFYVDAIQATWDDKPIGLVSVRQLAKVYPSGTPIGTQYLRLPDDDDIYVVLESAGCYKPEYEVRSGFRGLYNRSFERPYVEPCYLIFYKPRLPEFVRKVSGAVVHKVSGPTQRSTQRSYGRPRDRLPPRQREMVEFALKNRHLFRRKKRFVDRLRLFFRHPVTRFVGAIVILVIFYVLFRRQFNTLFGALSHFFGRR